MLEVSIFGLCHTCIEYNECLSAQIFDILTDFLLVRVSSSKRNAKEIDNKWQKSNQKILAIKRYFWYVLCDEGHALKYALLSSNSQEISSILDLNKIRVFELNKQIRSQRFFASNHIE